MSKGPRFGRGQALPVYDELADALKAAGAVERVMFAGSLRRGTADVGDIEILFIPKVESAPDPLDLFGTPVQTNKAEALIAEWLRSGILSKRVGEGGTTSWGGQIKLAVHVHSGIPVDLFTATRENWFNLLVCRTGPADLNTKIATLARERGMTWGVNRSGFYREDGTLHKLVCSERDVFDTVGLPYQDPIQRRAVR